MQCCDPTVLNDQRKKALKYSGAGGMLLMATLSQLANAALVPQVGHSWSRQHGALVHFIVEL
jgi:hypothetical protein